MLGKRKDINVKLARLRRTLIQLRRLIWPQRDVLNALEIEELGDTRRGATGRNTIEKNRDAGFGPR